MLLENIYSILKPTPADKVLLYVLEHIDEDLMFCETYDTIQKETGVSQPTIARVFRILEETGSAKHIGKSRWLMDGIAEGFTERMDPLKPYVISKVVGI